MKDDDIEVVDIGEGANDLETYSDVSIERLNQEQQIFFKWFKERTIIWISAATIVLVLIASIFALGFSDDADTRNWARQSLTVLLGFAAGAIWTSSISKNSD